jgi:HD-like signal output (HDOD) protein
MSNWESIRKRAFESAPECGLPPRVKLPVVPQSVIRFTHLADQADADIGKLGQTLESDASLTTELLRHVNSATSGLRRVHTVRQAISAIGIRRAKTLVLTAALQNAMAGFKSPMIPQQRFQEENVERALFARETARALGFDIDMAYTGGMVQDLLLPFLTSSFAEEYAGFERDPRSLVEYETEQFGWSHGIATARLMHKWGFPDELVLAVLFHHDLDAVLADADLRKSHLVAIAAASALPDLVDQSPKGLETLLRLQEEFPEFQFLEVAAAVDDAMLMLDSHDFNRLALCERLGAMAIKHLEQQRLDTVVTQKQVGNYTLEEPIGNGGMGVVYRARHDMLKRPAALKLLNTSSISPRSIARFESEVQLTSQLTSPNTIGIYDYGVTPGGVFYYAMEYIDGQTLTELVRSQGPLREARTIHLLLQACNSIGEAHSHGLIHRDIKPDNMMISNRGGVFDTLKVLDFGLAKVVEDQKDGETVHGLSGTPLYMSPDAVTSPSNVDCRSDIYSLGAVAYFLLTGEPVFTGRDLTEILTKHVEAKPLPPSVRSGRAIAEDLQAVIMDCLEKRPHRRPATIADLAARLQACQQAGQWTQTQAADCWATNATVSVGPTAQAADSGTVILPAGALSSGPTSQAG